MSVIVTMCLKAVFYSTLICMVNAVDRKFPPNFLFGAATAAYQIEGAWNISGKGENQWDRFVHTHPEAIADRTTGDVAADSYHNWQQDVAACADMGLHFYRFSLSWSRILPTGFTNQINEDGVRYYNNLIDALLKHNIEPMVTLYHWDLPQKLQDLGGWTNPLIADWFADYAKVAFSLFADRVKFWNTINEPAVICDLTYSALLAPGIDERIMAPFLCNKVILLAHAKAWRIYDEQFKNKYHGRVSIVNHLVWFEPATEDTPQETVELAIQFLVGRYSHAIYSEEGGWPPAVEQLMGEVSRKQGFNSSRLPPFTDEEKNLIRGTYDFFAFNHYTTRLVRKARPGEGTGIWFLNGSPDMDVIISFDPQWELGTSTLFAVYPPGIRRQLSWLKANYGDLDFIITENGYSSSGSLLKDQKRIEFIHDYLEQILLSIKIDNVNVIGYTYWSLIDNYEWMDGYLTKFGLYEVDFNDPKRPRIARQSSEYYASIIKSNTLIEPAVYSKQSSNTTRIRRKEPHTQNGGLRVAQNGRLINGVALVLLSLVLL